MIINRDNYEELFLMYVDGELTSAQRVEVENFVHRNPDLKHELDMLKQTILPAEEMYFDKKTTLYKTTNVVNTTNYLEYFLLDVDNELSAEEKQQVEKFVLQNPSLQSEFVLLQQTKIIPEEIVYKDKKSLYRTTERRVVPIAWLRMSVAAAIIGLASALWFISQDKTTVSIPSQAITSQQKAGPAVNKISDALKPVNTIATIKTLSKKNQYLVAKVKNNSSKRTASVIETNTTIDKTTKSDKIKAWDENFNEIIASNKIQQKGTDQTGKIKSESISTETNTVANTLAFNNNDQQKFLASHAVYLSTEPEEDDDDTVFIGSAEINKTKLRRLFKKATNFFDKKADDNREERTIRIASFKLRSK